MRRGITVSIQQTAVVDFGLQPGGVAEELVVTADAPLLQTGTGTVGETLGSEVIENLPINGRDYTILARLSAGVVPPQPGARAPLMFSANGVRPAQNNYLLDGIDNNTSNVDFLSGVAYIVKPPVDAVDEIKIMTSSFSAEYGRAGGAVLNTTLKSGTSKLRGSAWEFHRNDAMNANDFFANRANIKKGEYLSNQYGFTAGGPMIGSKTFWFADYEGSVIQQARTWVRTVPTAAQRASGFTNFSDLTTLQSGTVGADVLGRTFPRGTVFDPATTRQLQAGQIDPVTGMAATRAGFVRDAFPGNRIPASRIDPNALRLMQLYPEANLPGLNNNYVVNRTNTDDTHAFDVRVDHNFSSTDRFFARYSFSDNHKVRPSPFDGDADGGGFDEGDEKVRVNGFAASHTHMISSTLINEARFGLSREHTNRLQPGGEDIYRPAGALRHPGRAAAAGQRRSARPASDGPVAARSRRLGRQRALQQHAAVQRQPHEGLQVPHLQDRLHVPEHLLRLDAAALRARRVLLGRPLHVAGGSDSTPARPVPSSSWHRSRPLVPGGVDFLRGHARYPRLAVRGGRCVQDLSRRLRAGQLARLAQADGERRLSRWDYFSREQEQEAEQANMVPGSPARYLIPAEWRTKPLSASFVSNLAKDGIELVYTDEFGSGLGKMPKNNFAPRLDAAYQLAEKYVLRSGYGLFYGAFENRGGNPSLGYNYPFQFTLVYQSPNAVAPNRLGDGSLVTLDARERIVLDPVNVNANGLTLRGVEFDYKTPRYHSYNVMLQTEVLRESLHRGRVRRHAGPQPRDLHRHEQRQRAPAAGHEPAAVRGLGPTSRAGPSSFERWA